MPEPKQVKRLPRRRRTRTPDAELMRRAQELSDTYLGGLAVPASVSWVSNQRSRWGSCTPGDRTIRLSERLKRMPDWVVDYVLMHELAHMLEPRHDEKFWAWVGHYPKTEMAKGYLLGWSDAAGVSGAAGITG
ncbi:MAG: M48 family metallopeptidase [Nocardioidaceae bacterium]|nr:M48 family metallopeptidase [Nocardioidaceae bacterium]MCL2612660.1 M48 family metallopeptidase [Nocardioidaceae bacterium]